MTVWHEVVDFDVIFYCIYRQMGVTGIRYLDLVSHRVSGFSTTTTWAHYSTIISTGSLLSKLGRIMPVWLVSQVLVRIKRKDVKVVYKL